MTKKKHNYDRRAEERFKLEAKERLFPKMEASDVFMSITPREGFDAKFCLELGTAIMMDKPVIALVSPGKVLSNHMRRVADYIVEVTDLKNADEIAERLQSIMLEIEELKKDVPP